MRVVQKFAPSPPSQYLLFPSWHDNTLFPALSRVHPKACPEMSPKGPRGNSIQHTERALPRTEPGPRSADEPPATWAGNTLCPCGNTRRGSKTQMPIRDMIIFEISARKHQHSSVATRQPQQLAHRSALTQSEECAPESKPKPSRRRRWDTLADTSQSRTILPRTHLDASERLSSIRHTRQYRPHICSSPIGS